MERSRRFEATRLSDAGRYRVSVVFPDSGSWTWEVSQGGFAAHELGVLSVAAATSTAIRSRPERCSRWLLPLRWAWSLSRWFALAKKRATGKVAE